MPADKDRAVYMIGIAAKLVSMHPQTLRMYEREELVVPQRTAKETRLYSENDIELLKNIQELTRELGLNLAGVKMIFEMKQEMSKQENLLAKIKLQSESEIEKARKDMEQIRHEMEEKIEEIKKSFRHDIMPYKPHGIVRSKKK